MIHLATSHFERLTASIDWSERALRKPREERIESIKQFIGSHYADGGSEKNVPVNFLKLAVDIYVRQLAARSPRVLISTKYPDLKPTAANLQLAVNQIPEEINLTLTLRRMVTEALFSIGIVKCGLHTVTEVLGEEYGRPFVDIVTLDDFVCDMSAKRLDLMQFYGNSYWVPYEKLMDSGYIKNKDREFLSPDEHKLTNEQGQERADSISIDEQAEMYRERIHLRDIWLPQEKVMLTYAVTSKRLLRDNEWEGPERGPYEIIGYTEVPSALLPLSPVSVWRDLHELANALFRKLAKQADSQKTVLGFQTQDDEDIGNFQKASDGDGIGYKGAQPITLQAGGVHSPTLAFYLQVRDLYSYFAGNLDSLGGLAAMSKTVGQDRLLNDAASAQMADMSSQTIATVRNIFRSLAWYEWHDPVGTRVLEKKIPGTELSIPIQWNAEAKQGGWELYDLDLDVFSMQDDSPGTKLSKLRDILNGIILPAVQFSSAAGGPIDMEALIRIVSKLSNMEELAEILPVLEVPPEMMTQGTPRQPVARSEKQSGQRQQSAGSTPQGNSQVLQQVLAGANPQQSEIAALPGGR